MKRGLHQAPLPQMKGVLAGQQSFAEEDLDALEPAALVEVLVVRDEHVPDDGRVAGDEEVLAAHPQICEVAVLVRAGSRRT